MIFIILVLALAALVALPYIGIVSKRKKMIKRLTYIGNRHGFRVRPLHKTALLSFNRATRYDYLFENKNCALAVKLWSATRKDSTLLVHSDGTVTQHSTVPAELYADEGSGKSVTYGSRLKKTRQNFKIRKDKPLQKILLCYPTHKSIVYIGSGGKRTLRSGDMLFDKQICTPAAFEALLDQNKI